MKKILISAAAVAFASAGFAQTVLFNNMPNGTYYNGSNLNLNEEGEWFQTNQTGAFTLGGFDLDFNTTGTGTETFSNLQLEIQVYGSGASTYTGSTAAEFTSLLSTQYLTIGSTSLTAGYYYDLAGLYGASEITMSPVTTTDSTGRVGVVFTWLNGGVAATGVQTSVGIGTAPAVGSNAETDYNLTFGTVGGTGTSSPLQSNYLYSGTVPTNMAVELFAAPAPEPVSMTFLGLGVAGLIARKRRSAK